MRQFALVVLALVMTSAGALAADPQEPVLVPGAVIEKAFQQELDRENLKTRAIVRKHSGLKSRDEQPPVTILRGH